MNLLPNASQTKHNVHWQTHFQSQDVRVCIMGRAPPQRNPVIHVYTTPHVRRMLDVRCSGNTRSWNVAKAKEKTCKGRNIFLLTSFLKGSGFSYFSYATSSTLGDVGRQYTSCCHVLSTATGIYATTPLSPRNSPSSTHRQQQRPEPL